MDSGLQATPPGSPGCGAHDWQTCTCPGQACVPLSPWPSHEEGEPETLTDPYEPADQGLRSTPRDDLTFGECEGLCGRMVERIGWDRYCYACQDEMRQEDDEAREALHDDDEYLYAVDQSVVPRG